MNTMYKHHTAVNVWHGTYMEASSEHIVTCDKDTSTSWNVHDVPYVVTIIVQHFSKLLQLHEANLYVRSYL